MPFKLAFDFFFTPIGLGRYAFYSPFNLSFKIFLIPPGGATDIAFSDYSLKFAFDFFFYFFLSLLCISYFSSSKLYPMSTAGCNIGLGLWPSSTYF